MDSLIVFRLGKRLYDLENELDVLVERIRGFDEVQICHFLSYFFDEMQDVVHEEIPYA
jgi:hypothetical protein